MNKPILSNWPLFFGLTMIMIGNGLQGSLLGIRASMEGFDSFTTGIIMSCYFLGFLFGSQIIPKFIKDVGHIRVFAALASLASTTVLMHGVVIDPFFWALVRVFTGFSYAGLYIVIESWLNDASDNKSRGKVMAIYMLLGYLGMATGQLLLNFASPSDIELFVTTSILVSLALLPISLSKRPAPTIKVPKKIKLSELYKESPLGVTGMMVSGMIAGILFGIGAVYTTNVDYSVAQTSIFMSMIVLGGVSAQIPLGWLSDRFDRRLVLTGVMLFLAVLSSIAYLLPPEQKGMMYVLMFFLGGLGLTVYTLALAHTNDHLEKEQIMSVSSTMVLVNGLGAFVSPLFVTAIMGLAGAEAFFATIAVISFSMFTFALFRMSTTDAIPMDEQGSFIMAPVRTTSPMTAEMMKEQDASN